MLSLLCLSCSFPYLSSFLGRILAVSSPRLAAKTHLGRILAASRRLELKLLYIGESCSPCEAFCCSSLDISCALAEPAGYSPPALFTCHNIDRSAAASEASCRSSLLRSSLASLRSLLLIFVRRIGSLRLRSLLLLFVVLHLHSPLAIIVIAPQPLAARWLMYRTRRLPSACAFRLL